MKKQKKSQKKEVIYNLINAGLAGSLVLLGSFSTGSLTTEGICAAITAGLIVMITQFKSYWDKEKPEYCSPKLFRFI